jgi:hypothetical protein
VNIPFCIQENVEHALDLALHLSRLLSVSVSLDFRCANYTFFLDRLCNHRQRLCRTFSRSDVFPLSYKSRNRIDRYTTPNKRT